MLPRSVAPYIRQSVSVVWASTTHDTAVSASDNSSPALFTAVELRACLSHRTIVTPIVGPRRRERTGVGELILADDGGKPQDVPSAVRQWAGSLQHQPSHLGRRTLNQLANAAAESGRAQGIRRLDSDRLGSPLKTGPT